MRVTVEVPEIDEGLVLVDSEGGTDPEISPLGRAVLAKLDGELSP